MKPSPFEARAWKCPTSSSVQHKNRMQNPKHEFANVSLPDPSQFVTVI